ncbi:acyl-CoA dehydrogenase C-terminal domain-containing protein [Sphaerotilus sp.]|uniref:acyl-CoA dehydrogenase C-terminal domain-containing protein n=1 Tax=Sphaerotilus sp. TaxID=2093942 RepID=UPI0034E2378A
MKDGVSAMVYMEMYCTSKTYHAQSLPLKDRDVAFMQAKITTAQFSAEHLLVKVPGLRNAIVAGADSVCAMALDAF